MGVGHFFGLMPESLYPGTKRTGVELDSVTARIASKLYPDSNSMRKPSRIRASQDFFDAAIGNIPFGNYPVFDPAYRRSPHLTHAIHDYFLAKCLDVVRPGGVVALITSQYTMDKQDSAVRRHLAEDRCCWARSGCRIRHSGQTRGRKSPPIFCSFRSVRAMPCPGGDLDRSSHYRNGRRTIEINEYFARHPEMMLGRMEVEHGQYACPRLTWTATSSQTHLDKASSACPATFMAEREVAARFVRTDPSSPGTSGR